MSNQKEKHHIHITAEHKWFDLKLKEVWKYKDLIWLYTKRSFTVTYKQTILGPAWLFINPILTSLIYSFVFGGVAHMGTDGIPHMLFYLSGTPIWTFFSTCVTKNATVFTSNAAVFGKVYFPRLTMSLSNILSSAIQFGIQFLMLAAFLIYYVATGQVSPNWYAFLYLPLILIHLGIMGMGVGIIISSLTTKYRDLSVLVTFGVSLWMYATPVVYPVSQLGNSWIRNILMFNPATMPIELFRYAIVGKGTIDYISLGFSIVFSILVAVFGIIIFNKTERTFMDTV